MKNLIKFEYFNNRNLLINMIEKFFNDKEIDGVVSLDFFVNHNSRKLHFNELYLSDDEYVFETNDENNKHATLYLSTIDTTFLYDILNEMI